MQDISASLEAIAEQAHQLDDPGFPAARAIIIDERTPALLDELGDQLVGHLVVGGGALLLDLFAYAHGEMTQARPGP